jgi:hypothetical protein
MIPTTIVPPGSTHDMKPTETLSPAVYYFFWRRNTTWAENTHRSRRSLISDPSAKSHTEKQVSV